MKKSIKIGLGFGITSGIITTLGLMIGLMAGTHSKLAVLGGILTIAIADAMSDALGIHISQEGSGVKSVREVRESTIATFLAKFVFALTFTIPILLIANLLTAVIVSTIRGLTVLCVLNYLIAKSEVERPRKVIREHLLIAIIVVVITYFTGRFIHSIFG